MGRTRIEKRKGVSRCLDRLLKCFLALMGSGHFPSAVGRGIALSSGGSASGAGNTAALIHQGVVQPWRDSWQMLGGNRERDPRGRSRRDELARGRRRHEYNHTREGYIGAGRVRLSATSKRKRTDCLGLLFATPTGRQTRDGGGVRGTEPPPKRAGVDAPRKQNRNGLISDPPSAATTVAHWVRTLRPRTAMSQVVEEAPAFQSLSTSAGALVRPRGTSGSVERARAFRLRAPRTRGWQAFLWGVWRGLMAFEGWCESNWGGRACAHVVAGALASSHSLVGSVVVGLALWVSCAKRLGSSRGKDGWKQVARVTVEVAVLWYCHALPHGLGAGRPLRGNFGSGKAGDLLGAMWHFLGQGVFIRLLASSSRLVGVNVLEANGILLGMSCLGNAVAGSRMRFLSGTKVSDPCSYQLRGFFSRSNGIFGDRPVLSFAFDAADTLLALQGILSATEREVVRPNGMAAMAFRNFAGQAGNTLDAHSLGALGARNLMGMGFVRARVRMFGRPALSLGWTEKASNMCMVGDPICGSLLQKILDPTCVMLKGKGHFYDGYVACVGCLESLGGGVAS